MDNINYDNLNKLINYIENNLQNNIDLNSLAKIVGVSTNSLQRIFIFIAGISITDYIKKRRLSRAFEEIKNTNKKIIDIAFQYKYNSTISFDRAFKKSFGITPLKCRKSQVEYKLFPIITFNKKEIYQSVNYKIKHIDENELYVYKTEATMHNDLLYKIRELYNDLQKNNIHQNLKKEEQYAISYYKNGTYYYAVGSKTKYTSKEKIKIPSNNYIMFEVGTRKQKDIVNVKNKIYSEYINSTNVVIDKNYTVEYYIGDNCYLCMPIIAYK